MSNNQSKTPQSFVFEFEVVEVDIQGQINQRKRRRTEGRREDLGGGVALDLVKIPGGSFTMGSPTAEEGRNWYGDFSDALKGKNVEGPQRQIKIQPFWMSQYQVTQAQWQAVAALPEVKQNLEASPARFRGDNLPIEQVSWDEAVEFSQRLAKHTSREYRLPSEAEWEYACRAGTATPFHFGPTIMTDLANYNGTNWENKGKTYPGSYGQGPGGQYRQQTLDVGCFTANAFGLYDMHGNVWEWCLDHWHDTYTGTLSGEQTQTSLGENSLRLRRGGSWYVGPWFCRSANRSKSDRTVRLHDVGFRLVCAL